MGATVIFARHGHHAEIGLVLSGRSAIALSDTGRGQAVGLAWALERAGVIAVWASPRPRAQQTAAATAAQLGLPIQTSDALDEVDFGAWTGRTFDSLKDDPDWQRWQTERAEVRPPNGETLGECAARTTRFLADRAADSDGQTIAAFSHADTIKAAAASALGLGLSRIVDFDVDLASRTTLTAEPGGKLRLVALNERLA
jgi:broad specificity phosphatase PhoE